MNFLTKNFFYGLFAGVVSLIIFAIFFQVIKIDFTIPFFRNDTDVLLYLFIVKTIVDHGWIYNNPSVGLPNISSIYSINDHPQHSEFFNLVMIKFFNLFTDNIFLISNLFLIFTFFLIAFCCFIALRAYGISIFTSIIIANLYAFLPYHFDRNLWHLFLSNYAIIPLCSLIIYWMYQGKIKMVNFSNKRQLQLNLNRYFYFSFAMVIFACMNGFYYAIFGILAFIFCYILFSLKKGNFFNENLAILLVFTALFIIVNFCLNLPTIIGFFDSNFKSSIPVRGYGESYRFGLKLINLFLPIENHFFEFFANIKLFFNYKIDLEQENSSIGLGLLGASGFLFSLMWLLLRNNNNYSFYTKTVKRFFLNESDCEKISFLSSMNLLSIIFMSAGGGLIMFALASFPILRSNSRFVVFIAFFSFTIIAIIFDKIIYNKFFKTINKARIFVIIIGVLALLDQVGTGFSQRIQPQKIVDDFNNNKDFISAIENSLPANSAIFVLPFYGYPESDGDNQLSLVGYLYSKNLRWSYPVNKVGKSITWQNKVFKSYNFKDFIAELKRKDFAGIYLDRNEYVNFVNTVKNVIDRNSLEKKLKQFAKYPPLYSRDGNLMFIRI